MCVFVPVGLEVGGQWSQGLDCPRSPSTVQGRGMEREGDGEGAGEREREGGGEREREGGGEREREGGGEATSCSTIFTFNFQPQSVDY